MIRKKLLLLVLLIPLAKVSAQTTPLDPIIDTAAIYSGNISCNTGEVYVIYQISSNQIVSKEESNETEIGANEAPLNKGISVYPNPVTGMLSIKTENDERVRQIKLYSMDGKLILDKEIENNQLDLSNLLQGTYILKTDFNDSINFKIIKR